MGWDGWDAEPSSVTSGMNGRTRRRARERDDGESAMLDVNLLRPDKGGDPVREREASAR